MISDLTFNCDPHQHIQMKKSSFTESFLFEIILCQFTNHFKFAGLYLKKVQA